jgi:hypothetical protein
MYGSATISPRNNCRPCHPLVQDAIERRVGAAHTISSDHTKDSIALDTWTGSSRLDTVVIDEEIDYAARHRRRRRQRIGAAMVAAGFAAATIIPSLSAIF